MVRRRIPPEDRVNIEEENMIHRFPQIRFITLLTIVAIPFAAFAAEPVGRQHGGGSTMDWQLNSTGHDKATLSWSCGDGEVEVVEVQERQEPSRSAIATSARFRTARAPGNCGSRRRSRRTVAKKLEAARAANDDKAARKIMKDAGLDPDAIDAVRRVHGRERRDRQHGRVRKASNAAGSASGASVSTPTRRPSGPIAVNDQVIPDDLIVQGSGCVGFDCVNNESFGFDTIRLKENNLRIKFEDTSRRQPSRPTTGSSPPTTPPAAARASSRSRTSPARRVPFTITAGAPTNSIFVDSTGRVGFRTSTPVLDLHINTSNTPAIRLEQNNAGGFTAQTWDIGAQRGELLRPRRDRRLAPAVPHPPGRADQLARHLRRRRRRHRHRQPGRDSSTSPTATTRAASASDELANRHRRLLHRLTRGAGIGTDAASDSLASDASVERLANAVADCHVTDGRRA